MIVENANLFKKFPTSLYKGAAQLWIDKTFPRHLFIETTAACNLSCDYCPREKNKDHMRFELFKKIIDESSSYGGRSFSLHLFGEPMLYPYFFQAVDYIKAKHSCNAVLVTTNGTMVNKYIEQIISSGITKLIWSWRPEAKFTEETKRKLAKWGKMTVRIIRNIVPDKALKEWENWRNLEIRDIHNYGGTIDLARFGVKNMAGKRYPCYHLWLAPAVSWNGKFLMCCSDPHQKEIFGDVEKESISECWKRVERVRQAHLKGEFSGICSQCDIWKSYPDLFFEFQKHS